MRVNLFAIRDTESISAKFFAGGIHPEPESVRIRPVRDGTANGATDDRACNFALGGCMGDRIILCCPDPNVSLSDPEILCLLGSRTRAPYKNDVVNGNSPGRCAACPTVNEP